MGLEIITDTFGEALLGILAGGAVIALFLGLVNYVTAF